MRKYKIGEKIQFTQNAVIETNKGKKVKIKKGDEAMVIRRVDDECGEIVYVTGEAAGLSQVIAIEVDGELNTNYFAKKIMEEL
ncbi:hypothetical protein [Clostridium drakei]|uniref:Uncharacterized protein n=1 Tax=Clostridium drakei TaxID=332101 RepID=A0A2U8DTY6_9CLOT|nr:hypothetical protein [Clostridium drakei]AWI06079.1 hypothetical protein B9W14_16745 [Clostridium drakei]